MGDAPNQPRGACPYWAGTRLPSQRPGTDLGMSQRSDRFSYLDQFTDIKTEFNTGAFLEPVA